MDPDAGRGDEAADERVSDPDPADGGVERDHDTLDGMAIDEAVDAVVRAGSGRDREAVRAALERVSEDCVVSHAAADDAVAQAATVTTTPETRVELAEHALEDAREAAAPVADLDVVAARLDGYAVRLDRLERRLDDLREQLASVVDEHAGSGTDAAAQGDLYAVGRGVVAERNEADAVQRAADELLSEVEDFQTWVEDPATRAERLGDDVDAVAETLAELETATERIATVVAADGDASEGSVTPRDVDPVARPESDDLGDDPDTRPESDPPEDGRANAETVSLPGGTDDPAVAWFDVAVRLRTVALLLDDLRAETADRRNWAEREDREAARLAAVAERLDALDGRCAGLDSTVTDLARPAWTERFGDRLDAIDARLDELDPPVDWADVQRAIEEHRPAEG